MSTSTAAATGAAPTDNSLRSFLAKSLGVSAGQAITWCFALVWIALVPRTLGPAGFGRYVFASTVLLMASQLGTFGLDVHAARAVARSDPDDDVRAALTAGVFGAVIAAVVGTAVAAVGGVGLALWLGAGAIAQGAGNMAFSLAQGRERPGLRAAHEVVAKAIFVIGSVIAVRSGADEAGVAASYAAGYAVFALGGWFTVWTRSWLPRVPLSRARLRATVREAAPMGGHIAAQTVYYRADSALLAPLQGAAAAGIYGAAYKIFDTLSFVTTLYAVVLSPRLIRLARQDPGAARELARRSLRWMALLAAGASLSIAALAGPVVRILLGPDFAGTVGPLRLLGVALALSFVATPLAWILVATDRQGKLAKVSVLAAVLNVGINLAVIPIWGPIGAAATTVATEIVILAVKVTVISRGPGGRDWLLGSRDEQAPTSSASTLRTSPSEVAGR